MPRGKTLPKWPITPEHPDWPTCKCGCGKPVGKWHRGSVKDGVLMGQPHEYARGHNSLRAWTPDGRKRCATCGEFKFPDDFQSRGANRGVGWECKVCTSKRMKVYGATYVHSDPGKAAADNRRKAHQRRALERLAFVEYVDDLVVLERDDGTCGICGEDVDPFSYTLDHVIPISRGGAHAYYNVRVAHKSCNSRKKNRLDSEM